MDFVTLWKALSIVLTGAFGVLGLLKDYKDRATGKITVAGRVSLAGILLSSSLGFLAQLKESSDLERASAEAARQTLALAKNTDKTVKDLQRMLSPLQDLALTLKSSDGGMQLIWSSRDIGLISNGKLTSMIDLPQTTIILTGRLLDTMQLTEFALYSKSGLSRS